MNPRIPSLVSEILAAGVKTIAQPSGDPRRLAALDALLDLAHKAKDWPTDRPRRFVNDWSVIYLSMLLKIERFYGEGERDELARAAAVAKALHGFIKNDGRAALEAEAGMLLPDIAERQR